MEIICPSCSQPFVFRGGPAHFARNKKHFCSRVCQNVIHGLGRRPRGKKQDKRYRIWMNASKRSKQNGTVFEISVHDIPTIPERCPVLGIKIIANELSGPLDSSPSLDRINPALGYIPGNIRIICNRANRIKSDATLAELKLIIKDAKKHASI